MQSTSNLLSRSNALSLYKNLYKNLKQTKTSELNVYRVLLRNEFIQHSVSDSKYCMEKDQMFFLGNAYLTYLESTKETLTLYARYCKGERSIEQSANIVGLRLPKLYDQNQTSAPKKE
jgi:hypothetical protein